MQKGIVMQVQLYISGDDAPAHDFSQTGHDVALQVLQQGLQHYGGPYAIQVQKVQPVEGGDDDDDEPASGDALNAQPLLSYAPPAGASSGTPAPATGHSPQAAPSQTGQSQTAQPHAPQQPQPEQPEEQPKHHFWDR